ncbi:MAG: M13 family metallopeptidase [Bacteroidota bacterium]
MSRLFTTFILTLSVVLVINHSVGQTFQTKPLDPANMDTSAKPSDDFNEYANGGWLKNNPIPPDQTTWGSFNELAEKNLTAEWSILKDAAKTTDAQKGTNAQKVGDFYFSGMDSASIEAQGAKPLDSEFKAIAAISNSSELQKEIAHLQTIGVRVPFGFSSGQDAKKSTDVIAHISQGGLTLPDRDYYLKNNEDSRKIRDQYSEHVAKMFSLLGDEDATAKKEAAIVLEFETQLAKGSMTRVERRDPEKSYHKMSVAEVNALTPDFSWSDFFQNVGLANPGNVNVGQPRFMKTLDSMLTSTPLDNWKIYLRWHLVNRTAEFLSSPFVNEQFHFSGTILNGQQEIKTRWKRIVQIADRALGEAIGPLYVAKFFKPEAKARAKEMVNNLTSALHDRIPQLTWMSPETKTQALRKLDAFGVKVGYTDKWKDYSALDIDRGPFVLNILKVAKFDFAYNLNKIGKPVDKTEWGMTPPTVNAYYTPTRNEIVFPAGILQPPFFDPNADDAVNYGGMGSVIGHEITHGFDDEGRKYDADGNLKDWWTDEDAKKYIEQSNLIEKQFDDYAAIDTFHVNGKLTLGENTADLGGLTIAYSAFKKATAGKPEEKIDGFTPDQRFFLAWAQIWRINIRPEALKVRLNTDSHSPGRFRAIGPISNMQEFFNAFGVKDGDPMMRPEKLRAKLW